MGLLYYAIAVPKFLTTTFFVGILSSARFIFIGALSRLGLYKLPPEQDAADDSSNNNYILLLDPSSPSLVPVPVHAVVAAIKNRVRIVPFRDHRVSRQGKEPAADEGDGACSICLDLVELDHYVRDLCCCSHVFHRECLDTWIDEGQVTCPLCRSMLLPPKSNIFSRSNQCPDGFTENARHTSAT